MGIQSSRQRTQFHHNGDRGRWYRTAELFDPHTNVTPEEEAHMTYFSAYLRQCERFRNDSYAVQHNGEFQRVCEEFNEDYSARVADIKAYAQSHYHDVLSVVVDITDGLSTKGIIPTEVLSRVGRGYTTNGFFFFFWDSMLGDKMGRCELKACQHLMELHCQAIHVPLTYHIKYRGQAVTVQSLLPVTSSTRVTGDAVSQPDVFTLQRAISAAFHLKPYEEHGRMFYAPPDAQQHCGLDGRVYFLANMCWLPSFPPPLRSRGNVAMCRFSPLRLGKLAVLSKPYPIRAFHKTAYVWENTEALEIVRLLFDEELHELARRTEGRGSIVKVFREAGYNMNLMGLLLLSLLRNVTPPEAQVEEVLCEMFARGMKQYVLACVSKRSSLTQGPSAIGPTNESGSSPLMRSAEEEVSSSVAGGHTSTSGLRRTHSGSSLLDSSAFGMEDSTTIERAGGSSTFDVAAGDDDEAVAFVDVVTDMLKSFISYEGHEVPKQATAVAPAVLPPTDIFGGKLIPIVYEKFRLVTTDVDLYRELTVGLKHDIYQRFCELIGVVIEGGVVNRIFPLVRFPGIALWGNPFWAQRRLADLDKMLLQQHAGHREWSDWGPGLAVLVRQSSRCMEDLEYVIHQMELLGLRQLHVLALQNSLKMESLTKMIRLRTVEHEAPNHTVEKMNIERFLMIMLLRKEAAALLESQRTSEVLQTLNKAKDLALQILRASGTQGGPLYRAVIGDLITAMIENGEKVTLDTQVQLIATLVKHSEPDALLAQDYLQLAVLQAKEGDLVEGEQGFLRALRLFSMSLGESHPLYVRCQINYASAVCKRGRIAEAFGIVKKLARIPGAPPDVHEALGQLLDIIGTSENLDENSRSTLDSLVEESKGRCGEKQTEFVDSHGMIPLLFMVRQ